MKKSTLYALFFTVYFAAAATSLPAQSPFSGEPVSISKSSAPETEKDTKKPGLWSRFVNTLKKGYNNASRGLNKIMVDNKAPDFVGKAVKIPGHEGYEFVCQGITYLPEKVVNPPSEQIKFGGYKHALLSYYPETKHTGQPSQLVIIELASGKAMRRFNLFQTENKPYTGHAGGITVAGQYVWVASGFKLYGFKLSQILDFLRDKGSQISSHPNDIPDSFRIPAIDLIAEKIFEVDSKASFVSFDGNYLWVGDFVKESSKSFAPVAHHTQNPFKRNTWVAGYKVNENGAPTATQKYTFTDGSTSRTAHKPDRLVFCRESVQGMAVCGNYVALSISYGAANSKLALYDSPFKTPATKVSFKPAGQSKTFSADAWELADKKNWRKTVELAAGSEDLEYDGRYIYVAFEGASQNYRHKWTGTNPGVKISESFYLITPNAILNSK